MAVAVAGCYRRGDLAAPPSGQAFARRLGEPGGTARGDTVAVRRGALTVNFGALMTLQGLWGVEWCYTTYDTSVSAARLWATMVSVGVMAGNVIGSLMAPAASRRGFGIVSTSIGSAAMWVLLWSGMALKAPIWFTGATCALLGASTGALFVQLTAGVNDLAPKGQGGAVFGTINMMPSVGAIIGQWGAGVMIDGGSASANAGATAYTHSSFIAAFGAILVAVLVSQCVLVRMKGFDA